MNRFPLADFGEREMQNIREKACDNLYFNAPPSAVFARFNIFALTRHKFLSTKEKVKIPSKP